MADRVSGAGASDTRFDFEELITALRQAQLDGQPSGVTVQELADRVKMSPQMIRRYLRTGLESGRVRHVRVRRMRMNGILAMVDAYEWVGDAGHSPLKLVEN